MPLLNRASVSRIIHGIRFERMVLMHGRMVYALNIFSTVAPVHERLSLTRSGEDMRLLRNCKEKNIDTVNRGAYCRYHPFPCGGASAIFLLTTPPQSQMRRLCGLRNGSGYSNKGRNLNDIGTDNQPSDWKMQGSDKEQNLCN
jgi:hypothetical protein